MSSTILSFAPQLLNSMTLPCYLQSRLHAYRKVIALLVVGVFLSLACAQETVIGSYQLTPLEGARITQYESTPGSTYSEVSFSDGITVQLGPITSANPDDGLSQWNPDIKPLSDFVDVSFEYSHLGGTSYRVLYDQPYNDGLVHGAIIINFQSPGQGILVDTFSSGPSSEAQDWNLLQQRSSDVVTNLSLIANDAIDPLGPTGDVEAVKAFFNGQNILITYRDGEVISGTYYFLDFHFCTSGQYILNSQSRREAVLGNEEVRNFQDQGSWSVLAERGQLAVELLTATGERGRYPVSLLEDGSVALHEGWSVVRQGLARCT